MPLASYLLGGLGLAVLMVVHESGHYFAARWFGMRVVRFSIGFGPTLYKHQSKDSPTVYQIALIPFLAYVQVAGMNPYEETDPDDRGSYMNASLTGRIITIAAGPAANYLFASVLWFFGLLIGGQTVTDEASLRIQVVPESPAKSGDIRDGDRVRAVNHTPVNTWPEIIQAVGSHPGEQIDITVERAGETVDMLVTTGAKGDKFEGKIGIHAEQKVVPVGWEQALKLSLTQPARTVYEMVSYFSRAITGKEKFGLSGPVGMVKETAGHVQSGFTDTLKWLGFLSASLAGFNLLPVPALDGGRLLFLGFELATRRKPDAKVEAQIHAVGLLMLLSLIAVVTWTDIVPKH